MNGLQIRKLVIIGIDSGAEEKSSISSVYYLGGISELDEVGLMLLVTRGNEAMNLGDSGVVRRNRQRSQVSPTNLAL
jgi:hypothetical protein